METLDQRVLSTEIEKLARHDVLFKISIQHQLHNKYNFKKLKTEGLTEFHDFISKTVDKKLTISEVEHLWRRNSHPEIEVVDGKEREIFHFGADGSKFRIFGYYDQHGQLVIWKLDEKHRVHKV